MAKVQEPKLMKPAEVTSKNCVQAVHIESCILLSERGPSDDMVLQHAARKLDAKRAHARAQGATQ
ncbi:hypothetical protein ABT364_08020 [Massilia sp. SR12]